MSVFIVLSFVLAGFSANIAEDDSCVEALHELRTRHGMVIASKLTRGEQILYRLSQKSHFGPKKTAQLLCGPEPE